MAQGPGSVRGRSPWPWLLLVLTAVRLVVAAVTPLGPDEAYYWVWSRALAPGYLDHPPMVALWIRAGTALAGDGALGVRLLAPLGAALGSWLLAQAAEDLLPGRHAGPWAAALLNATLLFGIGAVTMTPDTPLLVFWTATLWALARLHATGRGWWWPVAGLTAGLAVDSKYTALLLAPAILLWLAASPGGRRWLRRPEPWLALAAALVVTAPMLEWNAAHGWASLAKQGGRAADWNPSRASQFVAELFGGQIALVTPLLALLLGGGAILAARRAWRGDRAFVLLAALAFVPAAVFAQHAFGDRVQANWPAIVYPAAAAAATALAPRWGRLRVPAVALGFALTALVYVQGIAAPLALSPRRDRTMLLGGWTELAQAVAGLAHEQSAAFVAAESYGDAAELARLLPVDLPVLGREPRWALFDLADAAAAMQGRTGLLLRHDADPPDPRDWAEVQRLPVLARARGGIVAALYRPYRVTFRPGGTPAAMLPRPR